MNALTTRIASKTNPRRMQMFIFIPQSAHTAGAPTWLNGKRVLKRIHRHCERYTSVA